MKKTYINPACKVRTMKIEAILANTIIVDFGEGGAGGGGGDGGMGFGGYDGGAGGGGGAAGGGDPDANKSLWDEE